MPGTPTQRAPTRRAACVALRRGFTE